MSISEDQIEHERLARQTAIKAALDESEPKAELPAEPTEQPTEQPPSPPKRVHPRTLRPLEDWEHVNAKGQVEVYRRPTAAEVEAQQEREFLKSQWDQDQEHAAKVKAAEREQEREAKYLKDKREKEARTGKRSLKKDTISLEEARRLGYLQSSSSDSNHGHPEWWSPGNPDGIMGGGR